MFCFKFSNFGVGIDIKGQLCSQKHLKLIKCLKTKKKGILCSTFFILCFLFRWFFWLFVCFWFFLICLCIWISTSFTLQGYHNRVLFPHFVSGQCLIQWNGITLMTCYFYWIAYFLPCLPWCSSEKTALWETSFTLTSLDAIDCWNWGHMVAFVLPQLLGNFCLVGVTCVKLLI